MHFGDKYRPWTAAFDAGYAAALATCETPEQVVEILDYVINAE